MELTWLEDFVCLARTLSFTRAAEERHITQSAFSRRIKSLEIWTGTALFDRSSYPVRLSSAGEEFLPVAKTMLIQMLKTRDDLRNLDRGGLQFHGFAAPHSISVTHLASYLGQLKEVCPGARTTVISNDLHDCCQILTEGACDFLLCYRHPSVPLTLDEASFVRIDLGAEILLPVCIPGPNGQPRWRLPGDKSAPIPHLAYARGSFLGSVVDHLLKRSKAALDTRHMDAFAQALKSLALQGCGVAWLPERSIAAAFQSGHLMIAGDECWEERLNLSIFAAPDRLDETGRAIWDFFSGVAAGTADFEHTTI